MAASSPAPALVVFAAAVVDLVAGSVGIVAEALRPVIGAGYLVHGLLLPAWFALVAWRLLTIHRTTD